MRGLAFIKCNTDGTYKSSVDKFYNEEQLKAIADYCKCKTRDLILILAGTRRKNKKSNQRIAFGNGRKAWDYEKTDEFKLLWVLDFPLFEYDEEDNRWVARHHPFTSPKPDRY